MQPGLQHHQHEHLHDNTHASYKIELEPASCGETPGGRVHRIRSAALRRRVLRTVKKINMAVMPRSPTAPPTSKRRYCPWKTMGRYKSATLPADRRMGNSVGTKR